jgi:hypothetical protein
VCSFVYGVMTAEETKCDKCDDILISYNKVIVFLVAVGVVVWYWYVCVLCYDR